jgi:hypothetical protein
MQGAESQTQNGGETAGSGRIWQDPAVSVRDTLGDSSSNIYIYIYRDICICIYREKPSVDMRRQRKASAVKLQ